VPARLQDLIVPITGTEKAIVGQRFQWQTHSPFYKSLCKVSAAFSKFLFFGFSINANASSPTKVTPSAIPIITGLFIAQFSPHSEVHREEINLE
jgi:hypothetical protein